MPVPSNSHSDGSSFGAAVIFNRKPDTRSKILSRHRVWSRNNSRDARTRISPVILPRTSREKRRKRARWDWWWGERRRGERRNDQRFKIEQFLIMPALLVIRDTGDRSITERPSFTPPKERRGVQARAEKKSTRARSTDVSRWRQRIRLFTRPYRAATTY